jgi:hypothetical protein
MTPVCHKLFGLFCVAVLAAPVAVDSARAQSTTRGAMQISWEVRNRFRLFKEERDFLLHVEATRNQGILAAEQALAVQSDGRGWARNTLTRLCIDQAGRISQPCTRDNVGEDYLAPADHNVTVRLTGQVPQGSICSWRFEEGGAAQESSFDCSEPINIRVRYGQPTTVTVDVNSGPEVPERLTDEIQVRDVLIAGLGDSIASGEGNPDRPIELSSGGFCFRNYLGGGEYFRPGRARFQGDKSCGTGSSGLTSWQRFNAQWSNAACHRSLYSYQTRTALALAVMHPHIAVTFLPLACTGATIGSGLLGSQRARECLVTRTGVTCQGTVNAQVAELREAITAAKRRQPERQIDLILLSVGANDIDFSGLVADVIVEKATERGLFKRGGVLGSVEGSRDALTRSLPQDFAKLREALKPLVGGDLARVVFVSYANPALANDAPCANGRDGFDIHPAFNADPQRLANVVSYVQEQFLPQLKALALCEGGVMCRDPAHDRMTLVDKHQAAFADHGMCARSQSDPEFDRQCFSTKGESFHADPVAGASNPLVCGQSASEFRAYSPRARWIRTANDSYFAAMTYPQGLPASMQPADIHDASWGLLSAVYGGAVHPTAEGHAAMADAALPAAIGVLGLAAASRGGTEELVQKPLQ